MIVLKQEVQVQGEILYRISNKFYLNLTNQFDIVDSKILLCLKVNVVRCFKYISLVTLQYLL